MIESLGARGVEGDALDPDGLRAVVKAARPDQVVHLLTALPPAGVARASQLRATNDLRIRGTANLLRAAHDAGVRRIVAESFVGVYGIAAFEKPAKEDDPLPPIGNGPFSTGIAALRSMEEQLRAARALHRLESVALRIGFLYGSSVPSIQVLLNQARAGRLFVPRGMAGVGAFVHLDDAVSGIVAAIEQRAPGEVYNIVDDEPLALTEFLTRLTRQTGTRSPRSLPLWIVRLAAPVMAEIGSARLVLSNERAKRELSWSLRYPTVDDGLAELTNAMGTAA